ncbi:MAG: hypothetical protein WDN26_12060 [Chitinophagaceae bacterium]
MNIILKKVLPLLLAPAILLSFTTKPAPINFSGQWKLNESKSELGEFRFAPSSIKVDQKADAITVSRESNFNGQANTRTETLTFDGKVTESTGGFGNSKRKSTAKWSDDGKTMTVSYTVNFDINGEASELKGTETWTLSDDGKTFTLQTKGAGPQGDFTTKAVYDKQ